MKYSSYATPSGEQVQEPAERADGEAEVHRNQLHQMHQTQRQDGRTSLRGGVIVLY